MSVVNYIREKQKRKKKKRFRTYILMIAGGVLLLNLASSAINNLYAIKQAKDELAALEQQIHIQELRKESLEQESQDPTIALERKAREMGYGSINDQIYMMGN